MVMWGCGLIFREEGKRNIDLTTSVQAVFAIVYVNRETPWLHLEHQKDLLSLSHKLYFQAKVKKIYGYIFLTFMYGWLSFIQPY